MGHASAPAVRNDDARRALVIGAGPGGLTAAVALSRAGIPAALFEQAPELRAVGAGVGVQPNALRALLRIGVGQRLLERGAQVEWSEIRSSRGKLLLRVPIGEISREFGTPTINALRSELQAALVDRVPPGVLRLGRECVEVEQDDTGVTARFADGREERGAVLIGADGGRSVVRREVVGDGGPRYSGFTAWRAIVVPSDDVVQLDTAYAFVGRGRVGLTLPCAPGTMYWGLAHAAPEGGEDEPGTVKEKVSELIAGYAESLRALVDATPEEAISRTDIYDRDPISSWVKGRMVLLGDAAHQTAPFAGQGAGIAMEDAIVLARELSLTGGLEDQRMITAALEAFQAKRLERTNAIVLDARRRGKACRMKNPVACALRNTMVRLVPSRTQHRSVAESVGYDI